MPRFFTLQEAEELLPRIQQLLQSAVEAHSEAAGHEGALERVVSRITYLGGVEIDPADYSQRKNLKRRAEGVVQQAVQKHDHRPLAARVLVREGARAQLDLRHRSRRGTSLLAGP